MIPAAHGQILPRNRLLATLPAEDLAKLWPKLETSKCPPLHGHWERDGRVRS